MLRLRATRLTGPEIAERLGLAVSTVGRILTRAGEGRLKGPGPTGGPRYQGKTPGELLHVDTKALDRFVTAGHRAHCNRSKAGRRTGLGQDHLHVAVDDATRLAYAALLPTQDAALPDFLDCCTSNARTGRSVASPAAPLPRAA